MPALGKILQECKMCFSAVKIIVNCRNKGKKVVTIAILNFSDVLKNVGLDPKEVKLIRHALSEERFRECRTVKQRNIGERTPFLTWNVLIC